MLFAVNDWVSVFQPTLPARGATLHAAGGSTAADDFNPRSPHGERPVSAMLCLLFSPYFNPRSPHGERR